MPAVALTGWQGLFEHAGLQAGQRLLINGSGGGVGGYAVQFAAQAGATVVATASPRSTQAVRAAGAHQIVDYTATPVTDAIDEPVDAVFNLVYADEPAMAALVTLIKPGGTLTVDISGRYPLAELAEVHERDAAGDLRGKIVITA
ncbi:zinc-binding dehydrogenase [Actinoplanes sp. NPDC048791]|uniref:zinc-binding dehydrogenase n=1 Tax=Actinoplanes sp. NPDC048791 TaxID=3154623 RepID=UPI00340B50B7